MKFQSSVVASFLLAVAAAPVAHAFVLPTNHGRDYRSSLQSSVVEEPTTSSKVESLTHDLISKLRFREVQRELEIRALDTSGTLSAMKNRLREAAVVVKEAMPMKGVDEETRVIDGDALDEVRNGCMPSRRHLLCDEF